MYWQVILGDRPKILSTTTAVAAFNLKFPTRFSHLKEVGDFNVGCGCHIKVVLVGRGKSSVQVNKFYVSVSES